MLVRTTVSRFGASSKKFPREEHDYGECPGVERDGIERQIAEGDGRGLRAPRRHRIGELPRDAQRFVLHFHGLRARFQDTGLVAGQIDDAQSQGRRDQVPTRARRADAHGALFVRAAPVAHDGAFEPLPEAGVLAAALPAIGQALVVAQGHGRPRGGATGHQLATGQHAHVAVDHATGGIVLDGAELLGGAGALLFQRLVPAGLRGGEVSGLRAAHLFQDGAHAVKGLGALLAQDGDLLCNGHGGYLLTSRVIMVSWCHWRGSDSSSAPTHGLYSSTVARRVPRSSAARHGGSHL